MGQCVSSRSRAAAWTTSSVLISEAATYDGNSCNLDVGGSTYQIDSISGAIGSMGKTNQNLSPSTIILTPSPSDEKQAQKKGSLTKGVAMSFGFRKKAAPAYTGNPAAARRLASNELPIDKNGNDDLTNVPASGRSTPKLVPPRKEAHSTRVSRFGFRQPNNNRLNKIADLTPIQPARVEYKNDKNENNNPEVPPTRSKVTFSQPLDNSTKVLAKPCFTKPPTKFTLQTTNLPKPQYPVRIIETKTAKTLANNTRKVTSNQRKSDENSSKDGSLTEDSGVSSNQDSEIVNANEGTQKPRTLDVVVKKNTFELRDVDDVSTEESEISIPRLPTAFHSNSGIVKERAHEYERRLSERKPFTPVSKFLKTTTRTDSSSQSSDDQWAAGEAMADDFSSSDEAKSTKAQIERLLTQSMSKAFPKNVLLTIEDPKFAALAAVSRNSKLLADEPSPTESLYSYTEIEDYKNGRRSSSPSKDICDKVSPPSPGTPTNASNSLSLSEGKDFLIDDEIADQPALVLDEKQNSENNTLIESTPKMQRRMLGGVEHSPLFLKTRKKFLSRSDSLETLSTCESITSDDLMMDFDISQDVADDRFDGRSCDGSSLMLSNTVEKYEMGKDWSVIVGQLDKHVAKHVNRSSRLLRSRGATPDSGRSLDGRTVRSRSSVAQSPLRLQSPRIIAIGSPAGYESDDSIKLERSCHTAMIQEVMGMKTMLLKLKRVLHEQADEEVLLRSETHNLFEMQRNGIFAASSEAYLDDPPDYKLELEDLKRQVLFLQGQVEDREKTVEDLQHQMTRLIDQNYISNSAPASTVSVETSNAATQTERMRPVSAGPSLLASTTDVANLNSVVSANERLCRPVHKEATSLLRPPAKLWRKPGEPASPQRFVGNSYRESSIPRRSTSRPRRPLTPS